MLSVSSFLTSLVTSATIFIVLLLVHEFLSRYKGNIVIYFPARLLRNEGPPKPEEMRPFAWVKPLFTTSIHTVAQNVGLDSAIYVRFCVTCIMLLSFNALYAVPILIPIAATSDFYANYNKNNPSKPINYTSIDTLAMGNIPQHADQLWAFAVGAWWMCLGNVFLLHQAYDFVTLLRRKEREVSKPEPDEYAILVRDIEKPADVEEREKLLRKRREEVEKERERIEEERKRKEKEKERARRKAEGKDSDSDDDDGDDDDDKKKKILGVEIPFTGSDKKDDSDDDDDDGKKKKILGVEIPFTGSDKKDDSDDDDDGKKKKILGVEIPFLKKDDDDDDKKEGGIKIPFLSRGDDGDDGKDDEDKPKDVLETFFRRIYKKKFFGSAVFSNLQKSNKVWKELMVTKRKLLTAEAVFESSKGTKKFAPDGKRPEMRDGWMGLLGKKVDTIDFLHKKIEELVADLKEEQRKAREGGQVDAGFAFFADRVAAASAAQSLHCDDSISYSIIPAPEPNDVIWENISYGFHQRIVRQFVVGIIVALCVLFYMIPISFISSLTTMSNLTKTLPFLKNILNNPALKSVIEAFLPQLVLIVFLALLPLMLTVLSYLEGYPSKQQVIRTACGKYFYFVIFNVFIGITLTSSLFSTLKEIIDKPLSIVDLLAAALPPNATFFITFVALKGFVSDGLQISGIIPFFIYHLKRKFLVKTQWQLNEAWKPQPVNYLSLVPNDLLVMTICLCYSIIAPLILPFGILYFCMKWLVYKHQLLNVFVPESESRGMLWPHMHTRICLGLIIAQITLVGYFSVKEFVYAVLLIPLPIITLLYYLFAQARFYPAFQVPSLEIASRDVVGRDPSLKQLQSAYSPECLLPEDSKMETEDIKAVDGGPTIEELSEEKNKGKKGGEESKV